MNRFDTKFIVSENSLSQILLALQNDYSILEINGDRIFHYSNIYYDDENFHFYYQHHNNVSNRLKIRSRYYIEAHKMFFEIKQKLSTQKTIKMRHETTNLNFNENLNSNVNVEFIEKNLNGIKLEEKILVKYKRVTLVSQDSNEKITIDTELKFNRKNLDLNQIDDTFDYNLEKVVIIEVKQEKANYNTKIFQILRDLNYKADISFSKYCIGLLVTGENLKYNIFKPTLRQIELIQNR